MSHAGDEAMQLRFKIETDRGLGMFGYLDFVLSIRRNWRGDANWNAGQTWRHITIGLRSPVVFYAKRTGLSSPRWFRPRFREANDLIARDHPDGSWGEWQITSHVIDIGPEDVVIPAALKQEAR